MMHSRKEYVYIQNEEHYHHHHVQKRNPKTTTDFTIYKKGAYCVQIEGWKEDQNEASVESAEKMFKRAFSYYLKSGFKEGDGTCKAEGFPV